MSWYSFVNKKKCLEVGASGIYIKSNIFNISEITDRLIFIEDVAKIIVSLINDQIFCP